MEHTIIKPSISKTSNNNNVAAPHGGDDDLEQNKLSGGNNEKFKAALYCDTTSTPTTNRRAPIAISEFALTKRYSTQTTVSNPLTPTATAVLRLKRKKWFPESLYRVFYHFKVIFRILFCKNENLK